VTPYRRLWTAGLVSETGDWLLLIALPVYVLQVSGSTLVTSTVLLLELAAAVVAGPLAGVLADRWDRRRTLVGAGVAQAVLLLPLLAVHGRDDLGLVYAVVAVQAVLATLNDPVRQALLPAVVAPDELVPATARFGVAANLARLGGGALGGFLLEAGGLAAVVAADAATFALAAALLLGRSGWGAGAPVEAQPPLRAWLAGLATVRRTPLLRGTLAVTALMALAQGAFVVLFVVFVLRSLGGGPGEVGLLRAVQAIGGILGGLVVARLARARPRTLVAAGLLLYAVCDAAIWNGPAVTTAPALYLALFVAVGVPIVATSSGLTAIVLTATPEPFRGRVASTHAGAFGVLQAAGMLLAGLLVEPVGLLPVLNGQAAVVAVAALVAWRTLAPPQQRPVAPDDGAEDPRGPVRPAVVGDELVVALDPPAVALGPDRALDHEQVRAAREAGQDDRAGADGTPAADEDCVPVAEGRHHGRPDHQDPEQRRPE
jgi:predicted MFS family arabinose efflux permease